MRGDDFSLPSHRETDRTILDSCFSRNRLSAHVDADADGLLDTSVSGSSLAITAGRTNRSEATCIARRDIDRNPRNEAVVAHDGAAPLKGGAGPIVRLLYEFEFSDRNPVPRSMTPAACRRRPMTLDLDAEIRDLHIFGEDGF